MTAVIGRELRVNIRDRRSHRIIEPLEPEAIASAWFAFKPNKSAEGQLQLQPRLVPPAVFNRIIEGTASIEMRLHHNNPAQDEQWYGRPNKVTVRRDGTQHTIHRVGGLPNRVIALGGRSGENQDGPRRVAQAYSEASIALSGLTEYIIDAGSAPDLQSTLGVAAAELERFETQRYEARYDPGQQTDESLLVIDCADAFSYITDRYVNTLGREFVNYGGATAGEYIYNLLDAELLGGVPANRGKQVDASLHIERRAVGAGVTLTPRWNQLSEVVELACLDGGVNIRYRLEDERGLVYDVVTPRDRTGGNDRIVISDLDPDTEHDPPIMAGDLVVYQNWAPNAAEPYFDQTQPIREVRVVVDGSGNVSRPLTPGNEDVTAIDVARTSIARTIQARVR